MTDYSDYRKWTEQEDWENREYFQEHEEYSPQDIYDLCNRLIRKAESKGLKGCFLRFSSHNEPYEDWLGPPSVTAVGYRPLNRKEKEHLAFEDRVNKVSEEKKIPPFEARKYLELKQKGII